MDIDLLTWVHLAARWIHVFAGIMWIGQTYFFTWLDGRFNEMLGGKTAEGEGRVWMVHSGGFYVVEKQKMPELLPTTLHWFRWEAAITWLSGLFLLLYVYYYGGLMVDETMNETTAMLAGIGVIVCSLPLYNLIWRTPLGRNETVGAAVSLVVISAIAFWLNDVMGPRAAYIHVGAMLGTVMAANVWMVIIPSQRRMVAAMKAGQQPDLEQAHRAKVCSKHNTFMVMPLVFLMISNHFPTISYGSSYNWLVLTAMVLVGWGAAKVLRRA